MIQLHLLHFCLVGIGIDQFIAAEILNHFVVEIVIRVGIAIDFRIFFTTDEAACFDVVASTGTYILCQKGSQLSGIYLTDTTADGEFVSALGLVINNTGMYLVYLKKKITDQS